MDVAAAAQPAANTNQVVTTKGTARFAVDRLTTKAKGDFRRLTRIAARTVNDSDPTTMAKTLNSEKPKWPTPVSVIAPPLPFPFQLLEVDITSIKKSCL